MTFQTGLGVAFEPNNTGRVSNTLRSRRSTSSASHADSRLRTGPTLDELDLARHETRAETRAEGLSTCPVDAATLKIARHGERELPGGTSNLHLNAPHLRLLKMPRDPGSARHSPPNLAMFGNGCCPEKSSRSGNDMPSPCSSEPCEGGHQWQETANDKRPRRVRSGRPADRG